MALGGDLGAIDGHLQAFVANESLYGVYKNAVF
jgi:hypothetical protein